MQVSALSSNPLLGTRDLVAGQLADIGGPCCIAWWAGGGYCLGQAAREQIFAMVLQRMPACYAPTACNPPAHLETACALLCPAPGKKLEAVESQVSTSGRLGRFMAAGGKKGECCAGCAACAGGIWFGSSEAVLL